MQFIADENGRECITCRTYKPWTEFNKNPTNRHGHDCKCRDCLKAYRRTEKYRENHRVQSKKRLDENPEERAKHNERMQRYNARPEVIEKRKQENALKPQLRSVSRVDDQGRECIVCKQYKPWTDFNKGNRYDYDNRCKACIALYRRSPEYRDRNKMRGRVRLNDPIEREKQNERMRQYYDRPDVIAKMRTEEYRKKTRERQQEYVRTRVLTPEQIAHRRERGRKSMRKFLSNPRNDMSNKMSGAIRRRLRGKKNGRHWEDLVGYTIDELRSHLERLWEPGMTWENYGRNGWHIDHVKPVSSFKYEDYEDPEFKTCWALENLMPRWCTTKIAQSHGSLTIGNINKGGLKK